MDLRLCRSQGQSLFQVLFGASEVLEFREGQAEIVVRIVVVRVQSDRRFKMLPGGSELPALILQNAVQIKKIKIVRMSSQQSPRKRPCRGKIAVEDKDPQVKPLSLDISRMEVGTFGREIHSVLIMHLIDVDGDQRIRQKHGRRVFLQGGGKDLLRFVEHLSLAVGHGQVDGQYFGVWGVAQNGSSAASIGLLMPSSASVEVWSMRNAASHSERAPGPRLSCSRAEARSRCGFRISGMRKMD